MFNQLLIFAVVATSVFATPLRRGFLCPDTATDGTTDNTGSSDIVSSLNHLQVDIKICNYGDVECQYDGVIGTLNSGGTICPQNIAITA
ncbi:hypothetical protein DFH06DRAFT_1220279 [Mycena polygramma]|nr:hypothetical protein DFH06DRAFT_1220279 [Mycena polygramma]